MAITVDKSYKHKIGIYSILNLKTNKIYDGSAIDIYKRIKDHRNALKRGNHRNKYLQNSFNKYGEENFIVWVNLILDNKEGLLNTEQYYIDLHKKYMNNSYNINSIAGNNYGYKHTDKTKKLLSLKKIGNKNPQYGNSGEKNPNHKLTIENIKFIRDNVLNYSFAELGRKFNVKYQTISAIIKNKTWKNI